MFYAAFSFYPFVSIRVIRGQKNLRKPQRFSPVAAWGCRFLHSAWPSEMPGGQTPVRQRTDSNMVNLEFAGTPAGNAVLDGIATSRHVPVIVFGNHFALPAAPRSSSAASTKPGSYSVRPCLYLDDVGIGARAVAVIRPQPVVIIRVLRQPGNASTRRVADVQILIPGHIIDKSSVRSHIQPVTRRVAHTAPVRGETGGSHIGCR